MMLPLRRRAISAPRIWQARKVPVTLTSSIWRKRSTGKLSKRVSAATPSGALDALVERGVVDQHVEAIFPCAGSRRATAPARPRR